MKNIILFSSDVASCVGRNKFKSRNEMLKIYWKRVDPKSYGLYAFEADIKDVVALCDNKDDFAKLLSANVSHPSEIATVADKAIELAKASNIDTHAAREYIKGELYKKFGTDHEDEVTQSISDKLGLNIVKTNSFVKKEFFVYNGTKVLVGGRLDGIDEATDTIYEVKNRMRGLMGKVPEYEMAQIQTYMFITGKSKSVLVERHADDVKMHPVDFDQAYWTSLKAEMESFAKDLLDLVVSKEKQEAFVSHDQCPFDSEEDV